ncbi:unnamed protein product [marine sediment metagenome]|uniref:Uncharacterized protein n=1 Tax=marine sediment metagenome TaxID=412755 RepID=X1C6J0_9ZZZZ
MKKKSNTQLKGGNNKMGFEPQSPAFAGSGVAIWKAKDKNNKEFLKVKVLGGKPINCFQVEEKKEE